MRATSEAQTLAGWGGGRGKAGRKPPFVDNPQSSAYLVLDGNGQALSEHAVPEVAMRASRSAPDAVAVVGVPSGIMMSSVLRGANVASYITRAERAAKAWRAANVAPTTATAANVPTDRVARVVELRAEGRTREQIAAALGLGVRSVARALAAAATVIPAPSPSTTPALHGARPAPPQISGGAAHSSDGGGAGASPTRAGEQLDLFRRGRVAWGRRGDGSRSAAADAFLRRVLAGGPLAAREVWRVGACEGFSRDTLLKSAKRIGVRFKKRGNQKSAASGWSWALPTADRISGRGRDKTEVAA